jgi:hypothetical protein
VSRQRFFFYLAVLAAAVLLIVASVAFSPEAVQGVGLGIGIASFAVSLVFMSVLVHQRGLEGCPELRIGRRALRLWSLLGGAVAGFSGWEIIQVAVFVAAVSRWLTLANGLVIAAIACAGLVAHEISTERITHVLEVVERPPRTTA